MKVPQIRMEAQFAQIRLEHIPSKQEIKQRPAELSIEQPKAEQSITIRPGKLTIDQSQAWEERNLESTRRFNEKQAQKGLQAIQDGTARRAEQGTELMMIEKQTNPIYEHAIANGFHQQKMLSLTYIPSPFAVKYHYEPADVQIDVQVNRPVIEAKANEPEHHYTPGRVAVQMERYQELKIDFENLFSETI